MRRPKEDEDLSIADAFVKEKLTGSVDTGIDFHYMRFLMRVAIPDGHDRIIACVRKSLESWPASLPPHHRELAEELIASLERKKLNALSVTPDSTYPSEDALH